MYRITARTLEVTEQGHITERYTKAIEQLGSDKLDVRLGGIYALERLAEDSPQRDHPTVVEVLSAFVREHSRRHGITPPKRGITDEAGEKPDATALEPDAEARPATDVQAAVSVLGRLPQQRNVPRGDLTGAQLAGAQLGNANLSGARLYKADLTGALLETVNLAGAELTNATRTDAELLQATLAGAELDKADLTGAYLGWADLKGARLHEANLSGAFLGAARLTDARLYKADLTGAWLTNANLTGADLAMANLTGADLTYAKLIGANLFGADLTNAQLHGAKLHQSQGLTQRQLDVSRGDGRTQLPDGLERPASWTSPVSPDAAPMTG